MLNLIQEVFADTKWLCFFIAIFCWLFFSTKRSKSLPPGPRPMPIIGSIGLIKGKGFERLESLAQLTSKYGKGGVCTIYFGNQPNIFVSDYDTIKRILNDDVYTGRPYSNIRDGFFKRKGLLFTDGPIWREQRRFALSTLRDFGMGKSWMQDLIVEEAQALVQDIKEANGKPINPSSYLTPSIANVICAISYGTRFDHKDQRFRRLTTLIGQNITYMAQANIVTVFPFLQYIPFSKIRESVLKVKQNLREIQTFLLELVTQRKEDMNGEPRDYIHAYLVEAQRQHNKADTTFTEDQLAKSIINLFGAGTETTSTTLTWAIIYLIENPEVYRRLQKEVDSVIPDGGFPNLTEKENLPYMQAVLMEVQRLANLVPFAGRRTMEKTTLNGFQIPADTTIIPNLYAVHMNPKYFPEPKKFDPERFLDSTGKIKIVEGFLPFSIGKRFCLGEPLAKMELFIFFASLLKHFTFRAPAGETISAQKSILGIVNTPVPVNVVFESR